MLNLALGQAVDHAQNSAIRTEAGQSGHVVYGPYESVEPGRYAVDFLIYDADERPAADDLIVARVDVTAEFGKRALAVDYVTLGDLRSGGPFRVEFDLDAPATLEYRVFAAGARTLIAVDGPVAVERSGDAPAKGRRWSESPQQQQLAIREILRLMRPHRVVGRQKVRMGNEADGGYVMIDDFEGVDVALSLGINDDITWDLAVADRGLKIYQFDHTVADPAPDDDRMEFSPTMIAAHTREGSINLEDLAKRHDKGGDQKNILLKMDIESWEWEAFDTLEHVGAFSQIVCELHYLQGLADPIFRQKVRRCLEKIHQHYALVHVHGNIHGGLSHMAGVTFPNVLEVTFVNRSRYQVEETDELFPGDLDASCDPERADIWLGSFRF
jgi:hypothetical protein